MVRYYVSVDTQLLQSAQLRYKMAYQVFYMSFVISQKV